MSPLHLPAACREKSPFFLLDTVKHPESSGNLFCQPVHAWRVRLREYANVLDLLFNNTRCIHAIYLQASSSSISVELDFMALLPERKRSFLLLRISLAFFSSCLHLDEGFYGQNRAHAVTRQQGRGTRSVPLLLRIRGRHGASRWWLVRHSR